MQKPRRNWKRFALLLIDVQQDFWPTSLAKSFPSFPAKVENLLTLCRAEGIDVIHFRASFLADQSDWMAPYKLRGATLCVAKSPGAEILPCAQEIAGEKVFKKRTFDGFLCSEFEAYLKTVDKRFFLVAGLETSVCVLLTALSAVQKGYLTAMIGDCSADRPEAHQHASSHYSFAFETVQLNELIEKHSGWQRSIAQLEAAP